MKTSRTLGLCLILNLALAGAVVFAVWPRPARPAAQSAASPLSSHLPRAVERKAPARPSAATNPAGFNWRQIESPDYPAYIANLRAIGCPEETLRDIIIADVNKLYAPKWAALVAQAGSLKYWQTSSSQRRKFQTEAQNQLRALHREKRELIRQLLGIDPDLESRKYGGTVEQLLEEGQFAFLPEAKRAAVREIQEKYQALETGLAQQAGGVLRSPDNTERNQLRQQCEAELAAVLTPEEKSEYDLRRSTTADNVRSRLAGFEVTEEEFRSLFALRKGYEEAQGAFPDYSDPEKVEKRRQAKQQLESQYRQVLGEERFAELTRNQDFAYQGLVETAQQHSLSQQTINQVYDIKKAVGDRVREVLSNGDFAGDARAAALKEIGAATEKELLGLMGEKALQDYKQGGGYWLRDLSRGRPASEISVSGTGNSVIFRSVSDSGGGQVISVAAPVATTVAKP